MDYVKEIYLKLKSKGLDDNNIHQIAFGLSRMAIEGNYAEVISTEKEKREDSVNKWILKLYNDGVAITEIAKKTGLAHTTVDYKLNEMGVKRNPQLKGEGVILTLMAIKYNEQGLVSRRIGELLGIADTEIRRKIKRYHANKEWFDRFKGMTAEEIDAILVEEKRKR